MQRRGCHPPTGRVYPGALVRLQFCPKFSPAPIIEGLLGAGPCPCAHRWTAYREERTGLGWPAGHSITLARSAPEHVCAFCRASLMTPCVWGQSLRLFQMHKRSLNVRVSSHVLMVGPVPGEAFSFLSPLLGMRGQERGPAGCLQHGRPREWVDCKLYSFIPAKNISYGESMCHSRS